MLLNNYYGRQFNSLNDVTINPRNGHIYFTDTLYGYLQAFRPKPGLPRQVWRLDPETMAVTAVADGFDLCNGKEDPPRPVVFPIAARGERRVLISS